MNAVMEKPFWRWVGAGATGIGLTFVQCLDPLWPIAWLAPLPLLLAVRFTRSNRELVGLALFAALVGQASMAVYYFNSFASASLNPFIIAVLMAVFALPGVVPLFAMIVIWRWAAGGSRHFLLPFAFPVVAAAVDFLFAAVSPNGTLGSWAYSQMQVLPVIQIASLGGTPIIVFLVSLLSSTFAVALMLGGKVERPRLAYGLPLAVLVAALTFGVARLSQAPLARSIEVGMAATDIDMTAAALNGPSATNYRSAAARMVTPGTQIIVLPEMMEDLKERDVIQAKARYAGWTRQHRVGLLVGVNIGKSDHRENRAWFFDENGAMRGDYSKEHLIPLINYEFRPGHDLSIVVVDGARLGVAICKDLDFPSLAREYASLGAQVLLVPALDFDADGEWHARMAVLRGVEQGMSIVRAANDGLMSVSDSFGRIAAEAPSGRTSIATLKARAPLGIGQTIYGRFGDIFGWLCVVLTVLASILAFGRWRRAR